MRVSSRDLLYRRDNKLLFRLSSWSRNPGSWICCDEDATNGEHRAIRCVSDLGVSEGVGFWLVVHSGFLSTNVSAFASSSIEVPIPLSIFLVSPFDGTFFSVPLSLNESQPSEQSLFEATIGVCPVWVTGGPDVGSRVLRQ